MNIKQAQALIPGDRVHYTGRQDCQRIVGPRGGITIKIIECRVSGAPKLWKTRPYEVRVPVKYGMYENSYITQENLNEWHLASACPLLEASLQSTDPEIPEALPEYDFVRIDERSES